MCAGMGWLVWDCFGCLIISVKSTSLGESRAQKSCAPHPLGDFFFFFFILSHLENLCSWFETPRGVLGDPGLGDGNVVTWTGVYIYTWGSRRPPTCGVSSL